MNLEDVGQLLEPPSHQYYRQIDKPEGGWPKRDTAKALADSLTKSHDNIKALVHENDRLRKAGLVMDARQRWMLKWGKRILWAIGIVLGGTWTVLAYMVPYAVKGMAK